jgi:hypothetical protein
MVDVRVSCGGLLEVQSRMSPSAVGVHTMSKAGMAALQTAGQAPLVFPHPPLRLLWLPVDPKPT